MSIIGQWTYIITNVTVECDLITEYQNGSSRSYWKIKDIKEANSHLFDLYFQNEAEACDWFKEHFKDFNPKIFL